MVGIDVKYREQRSEMQLSRFDQPIMSTNEIMILDIIRRTSGIIRSGVTGHTNLTQQAVHRIIDSLIQQGYVTLGGSVAQGRGKPSPTLHLNPEACFSIGVSLNTDALLVNLVDFSGKVIKEKYAPLAPTNRSITLRWLDDTISQWQENSKHKPINIIGVGFAISGYFTKEKGCFKTPSPLADWSGINLQQELENVLQRKVWVMNNATTGAIGETMYGAGLKYDSFGYLSFNFGFGAGIVLEGKPLFGSFGNAGEIGRIYTQKEVPDRPALGELLKVVQQQNNIDIASVSDLKHNFDPSWDGVNEWVNRVRPYLMRAINSIRAVVDPEAIIFGGELPKQLGQLFIEVLKDESLSNSNDLSEHPVLQLSEIQSDPAAFGAAMLPLRETFFGH